MINKNDPIYKLQISALSRINFCYANLKLNPPLIWKNNIIDSNSIENSLKNYLKMNNKEEFNQLLYKYLSVESTTEALIMLIINYLYALLIQSKNNKISIYKNFQTKMEKIQIFSNANFGILKKIQNLRNKLYSHMDVNYMNFVKELSFDELEKCIKFLNNLLEYPYENLNKYR